MHRRLLTVLISILLFVTLAHPSLAQEINIGVTPSKLDFEIRAGDSYTTKIRVSNNSDLTSHVIAYAGDYSVSQTNVYKFFDAGEMEASNAKWITITPNDFHIPPGGVQEVTLTLKAPMGILYGTHHSAVFFETKLDPIQGEKGMVGQVARIGTAVVSAVGDPALPFSDVLTRNGNVVSLKLKSRFKPFIEGLKFKGFTFKGLGLNWEALVKPEVTVKAVFEATGNTHLNVGSEGTFKSAWFGEPEIDTIQPMTILPKGKREFDYLWDKAPAFGPASFHGPFIYPTSQTDFAELEVERSFWIIPWTLIILTTSLIALIIWIFTSVKRRLNDRFGR
ncbi:MAG: hypothetical protein QMD53_00450 [Actinomycetota bacterium]|nr:hypothetical protein [Actinomycetota bacterium]